MLLSLFSRVDGTDADRVHAGAQVEVGGDDRGPLARRNVHRSLQLLPRRARVPPGSLPSLLASSQHLPSGQFKELPSLLSLFAGNARCTAQSAAEHWPHVRCCPRHQRPRDPHRLSQGSPIAHLSSYLLSLSCTRGDTAAYILRQAQDGKPIEMTRGKEVTLSTDYDLKGDHDCFAIRRASPTSSPTP